MESDKDISKLLLNARKSLNLSLQQVSESIKIRPHILNAIENGDYSILPIPYLLSSVKTYAKALRLPEEDIQSLVNFIKAQGGVKEEKVYNVPKKDVKINIKDKVHRIKLGKYEFNISTSNIINYLIYFALGLTVIVLVYVTFFMEDTETRKFSGELEKKADTTVVENVNEDLTSFFDKKDSIILEARSIDTAWMKIVIDGKKDEQITFYPDMERQWSAKEFFILSIINEGAIKFYKDGEELPSFGRKGTLIRNIKITRDEIDIASSPWGSDSLKKKRKKKQQTKTEDEIRFLEPSNVKPVPPKINK